ncbi:uncharacterized protein LOC119581036 [Penaeus monodon]|uniref:uncharacterized protein LOC119581034 n=1 Tax=Penaeus monodon TaxID=6687 RepID=UPI0018A77571|nr:uncharacterized protein LOC119581034 [Penaeus monodon]XP_037785245.1 uncharacterized protein LOC119581034 [Penaeus monodon]XP_037785246.1 uncharacterized protein LOC119581035 [Penaeus monodon]XP_037785249.1 uncharacterized protein LOC119581035 [Penaeus monodon]XP_037785250.1 uncharacterized protein LOC119581036 [Penaeus monodon]XP_037785251.1 uncharacterized protein LOC119581036 [Penaeus monodon]
MAKLAVFLVAVVAIAQTSAELQCYTCIGYNSSSPFNEMYNNPFCVSENFQASKVPKLKSQRGICYAETDKADIGEITVRYGEEGLPLPRNYLYMTGYLCQGHLCNSRPTSSAGTSSLLLPLMLIPAVLSRLLT